MGGRPLCHMAQRIVFRTHMKHLLGTNSTSLEDCKEELWAGQGYRGGTRKIYAFVILPVLQSLPGKGYRFLLHHSRHEWRGRSEHMSVTINPNRIGRTREGSDYLGHFT